MAVLLPYKGNYYLWKYLPSIPAAAIFVVLFLIITILQGIKLFKTRAWFGVCFALGCLLETLGYIVRISAHNKTNKLMPYIIQNMWILIAPTLYAASIYMTLGHLLRFLNAEHHSPIRANWITKAFVAGDILSFLIQGGSSGLTFNQNTQKIGEGMVVAGLLVQVISFGLFFVTAIVVHRRINQLPTNESLRTTVDWAKILYMLYVVSILILVRSLFRVVEYIMGGDGYLLKHEWTLYAFDTLPMFVVAVAFWYYYPNEIRTKGKGTDGDVELSRSHESDRGISIQNPYKA